MLKILIRKTKVFLKYYHYEELKVYLNIYINSAVLIQKCKYLQLYLKNFYLNFLCLLLFKHFEDVRRWLAIKKFNKKIQKMHSIQEELVKFISNVNSNCEKAFRRMMISKTGFLSRK